MSEQMERQRIERQRLALQPGPFAWHEDDVTLARKDESAERRAVAQRYRLEQAFACKFLELGV